jgi:hypothetical protein
MLISRAQHDDAFHHRGFTRYHTDYAQGQEDDVQSFSVPRERVEGPSMPTSVTGDGDSSWGAVSAVAVMLSRIVEVE